MKTEIAFRLVSIRMANAYTYWAGGVTKDSSASYQVWVYVGGVIRHIIVNTLRAVNWQMRIGGFLSRRLGLVSLGRPLVARGARRAYPQLTKIVRATKAHCRSVMGTRSPVSFPTNQE